MLQGVLQPLNKIMRALAANLYRVIAFLVVSANQKPAIVGLLNLCLWV